MSIHRNYNLSTRIVNQRVESGLYRPPATLYGQKTCSGSLTMSEESQKMSSHKTYLNYSLKDLEEDRKALP
jgi:hypothetical protein